ncbi:MAG: ABC transporter substrate-binding protein [Clostridiales bacterium 43-6]|nr:MAG: ABC transporter substrate-binding protein [Clostridiales bacterium 43-6]
MITAFTGCTTSTTSAKSDRISVVATIFPQYDFARAVVGNKADLTMLIPPGSEIHSYEPSPSDIIKIQNSDVFIYIGGESDTWVDKILSAMDIKNKKIVKMMDCVTAVEEATVNNANDEHEDGETHEDEEEPEYDEHVWTSPKNAVKIVSAIKDAVSSVDTKNAKIYESNATDYRTKITELDTSIQAIVSKAKTKTLVVGDRFPFRYFADEFGLSYKAAFAGCSKETEASAATIAELINYIKQNNVKTVYSIELSNQNIAKTLSEQTGAKILLLHSCHNLAKSDFDSGATYVSLMRTNALNLEKGLN